MMHCGYCNYVAQILVKQVYLETVHGGNNHKKAYMCSVKQYQEISKGSGIRSVELLIPLKEHHLYIIRTVKIREQYM